MNENEMENISLIKGMLKRKENSSAHDHYRILEYSPNTTLCFY